MAGYGLYYALRGKNNWAQRRQDAQINLQYQQQMAQMEQEDLQQSLLAEKEIQDAFDVVRQMDYLEGDKERVFNKEKQLRSNIVKQIGAYNGDLKRYMSAGGMSDLKNYQRSLEDSQEVKLAKQNKAELAMYMEDLKKGGKYFRKTKLRIPLEDEQGNRTGEFEEKLVDFKEQLALHQKGMINTLRYAGSEELANVNAFTFKDKIKDAKNPLGDNRVTMSDVYNAAIMQKGVSEEQAYDIAKKYNAGVEAGGDVWRWGSEDPYMYGLDAKLKQAQYKKLTAGSEGDGRPQGDKLPTILFELNRLSPGEESTMTVPTRDWFLKTAGYKVDNEGNYTANSKDNITYLQYTDKTGKRQNAKINAFGPGKTLTPSGRVVRDPVTNELMMQADMTVDMGKISDDKDLFVHNQWFNEDIVDKFEKDNLYGNTGALVSDLGDDIYSATVYIPIQHLLAGESLWQDLIGTAGQPYSVGKGGYTAEYDLGDVTREEYIRSTLPLK